MINRVVITGRMTRDAELRTTATGKNVASFSVAVNKRFKPQDSNEPDAFFFRVSAWGQTAEFVSNYLGKGRLIGVEGRLEQRKYTDKDGHEREIVEIVADQVTGLDRPKDDQAASAQSAPINQALGSALPDDYDPFGDE